MVSSNSDSNSDLFACSFFLFRELLVELEEFGHALALGNRLDGGSRMQPSRHGRYPEPYREAFWEKDQTRLSEYGTERLTS